MTRSNSIKLNAHAKINLGLRILSKRPDGYHNLESIFLFIEWHDILTFTTDNFFSFSCSDAGLPADENNLVVRSVREVEKISGKPFPFSIHLQKNIPYGAGLGGGSSDAAAVFNFCRRPEIALISKKEAENAASVLGSDINFFLGNGTQIATDRGIVLKPVNFLINAWILTVFPETEVPTKWAYSIVKPNHNYSKSYETAIIENPAVKEFQHIFINDFDEPVSAQKTEIQKAKSEIIELGAEYTSLSGSGSAVFGLFTDKNGAEHALTVLSVKYRCNLTPPRFAVK